MSWGDICITLYILDYRFHFLKANGFHYDVIGGIHNLLATQALNVEYPDNELFRTRLCIVYDTSLGTDNQLWLANQHNLIGEYRHTLSFREKVRKRGSSDFGETVSNIMVLWYYGFNNHL